MPRYSAFREETRKAYEQIYLVNALSTMHVWSVIKDDRQQRNNTFFILLPLELLPDHYILLLLAGVSRCESSTKESLFYSYSYFVL